MDEFKVIINAHVYSNWIKINPEKAKTYWNETNGFREPLPKIL